jgi:antitoxin FitA
MGSMSQLLILDIAPEVVEQLQRRAYSNRRSLQAELRLILEGAARDERKRWSIEELVRIADEIKLRSGPQKTDSVDLIREDRDH